MNAVAASTTDVFEFPCSFAQQRVWIDERLSPGSPVYNIHASIRVQSLLEPGPLQRALEALIERHETLRTTFIERDGAPLQRVAACVDCDFAAEDLRRLDALSCERRVLELAQAQTAQPFDLERGPLLRTRLLRTDAAECILMLTVHHIVADAWSMGVLLREITALYVGAAGGPPAALPTLAIQYADYAVWQRESGSGAAFDADLAYWRAHLADLPTLELPTDHARPAVATHRGRTLHFAFDETLSQSVLELARRHAVTPYVVLVSALAVVLQRNCGQDEVVIGTPVAGRDQPELENLIGFFVNTLVLRVDLAGEPTFAALAQRVQQVLQQALSHQALPFERLVEELHRARDLSRNPLFQVSAQYLAAAGVVAAVPAAAASVLDAQRGAANFDLSFDFWQAAGRLQGRVDYALDLFEASTVERWISQLRRVLGQALADPGVPIESLDLLSPGERVQLLGPWAGEAGTYPRDASLPQVLAEVAGRQPDAIALRGCGIALTYAQLDERARRCAALLAERGGRAGDCIGVALARGADQVAAVIAVLRLGAAYVALDPAWPAQRLAQCIEAAALELVLCAPSAAARFAALGVRAVDPADRSAAAAAVPLPRSIDPMAPAYVAFTSGSTGIPKGVVVPHRAVLRLVCGNPQVPLAAGDVMLMYAPLAFDASTLEIWGALCNGACLSAPPPGPLGLDELAGWIERERVSVAWLTAGLFHQLAAAHAPALARIERLYAGGDVLSGEAVRRLLAHGGRCTVLNGYGPTENTTFTCVHAMHEAADAVAPVPIGRPIAGGYVRVLDRRGRLVPVGVPGELYAGGDGVALGYLGEPALSAQAFLPDPFDPDRGRVYRTGDRVRWRADGVLEFLGRIDRQLKVRGYRIEPGEVETALRALPGVTDAHLRARSDGSGDKTLVAYVAAGTAAAAPELMRQLGERLPAWMLPDELHVCAELRLTANGKIDETALAQAAAPADAAASAAAAAGLDGEVEALVAQIWAEVLARPVTDAQANFFTDLSGHSLLATQAVSRLNAALGIQLPLAAMFEEPTARGIAQRLETLLLADLEADAP